MLLKSAVFFAASFAWAKTGNRMAAKIAMIAMTTKSSMSVKALDLSDIVDFLLIGRLETALSRGRMSRTLLRITNENWKGRKGSAYFKIPSGYLATIYITE
jgi:hypothetical protein